MYISFKFGKSDDTDQVHNIVPSLEIYKVDHDLDAEMWYHTHVIHPLVFHCDADEMFHPFL